MALNPISFTEQVMMSQKTRRLPTLPLLMA